MTDMNTGMPFWWTGPNPVNVVPPNQALQNNLAQNTAANRAISQAVSNASAAVGANANTFDPFAQSGGFGTQTNYYSGLGAAYGRGTGGFGGQRPNDSQALSNFGGGLFDEDYYRQQNPDVAAAGVDPTAHWFDFGQNEGRTAHTFNPYQYQQQNPDVWAAGADPFEHYNLYGKNEGRTGAWSEFNPTDYLNLNPDVKAAGVDPTAHWFEFGEKEGRQGAAGFSDLTPWFGASNTPEQPPNSDFASFFDRNEYLRQNPDVAAAGADPWQHYQQFGQSEGRANPADNFHYAEYLADNPDVLAAGVDPLEHWNQFGFNEGRHGGYEWSSQNRAPGTASETLLADQRANFAATARKDPNLMFKLAAKAMQEDQNSSEGRTAVIEAMMNRLNATGDNPLNPKYYPTDKAVYNAEIENRLRNNPALLQQTIGEVERAFGGSNIAKYGTNWSSGNTWLNEAKYVTPTQAMGANQFYIKDLNVPDPRTGTSWAGAGNVAKNKTWFNSVNGVLPY